MQVYGKLNGIGGYHGVRALMTNADILESMEALVRGATLKSMQE